jgi:hypothetical protein
LFYRKDKEAGLSVGLSKEAVLDQYPGAAGMCSLVIQEVIESPDQLSVVQDDIAHANIMGVPTRAEDQEKALRIAKYLVRVATHCAM